MSRIFISYKRTDKDKVFKIKDQIEAALGEKCWIDLDGIESDAQFASVIIQAIDNAEIVLFMHSKVHTLVADFENDWTVRELNYAKEENKKIVFVNIDNAPLTKWFKFMFPQKQLVDGTSKDSIRKLCSDLTKWLFPTEGQPHNIRIKVEVNDAQINSIESYTKLLPIIQNSKFGFLNRDTKQLQIACEYDNVGGFNDGLCWVKKNDRMGFINCNGTIVIPVKYDFCASNFYNGYVTIRKEDKWGILDKKGKIVLPFIYDGIIYYDGELAIVEKDKKCAIVKNDLTFLVGFVYDRIEPFVNGFAEIELDYHCGLINRNGIEVIPCIYGLIWRSDNSDIMIATYNLKHGLIDVNNNVLVPFVFDALQFPSQDIVCAKKYGKWGYINTKGQILVGYIYDDAKPFFGGFAIIKKNEKFGMINKSGNIVIPIIYDYIYRSDCDSCKLLAVSKNGHAGYINYEGKVVIPFIYDGSQEFNDGYAAVCKNMKWGFINTQGKLVIPFKYDDAPFLFENGKVAVELNGKEGYVDSFGNDTFV